MKTRSCELNIIVLGRFCNVYQTSICVVLVVGLTVFIIVLDALLLLVVVDVVLRIALVFISVMIPFGVICVPHMLIALIVVVNIIYLNVSL